MNLPQMSDALIHAAVPRRSIPDQPLWLWSFARWADMGVLEIPGKEDHPLIVQMLHLVGFPNVHDETPWCAAAMHAAMIEAGLKGTGRGNARSYAGWGAPLQQPRFGCIAVLWRGTPNGDHGHVTLWLGDLPNDQMAVLGGNQHNRVCVATYPRSRLLSFRWPDRSCLATLNV